MNRRFAMNALGAATLAACARAAGAAEHEHDHHRMHGAGGAAACTMGRYKALVAATSDCVAQGQACLAHCLRLLAGGNRSLGACATAVNQVLPLCAALQEIAGQESALTPKLAKVVLDAYTECADACKPHVEHHAECKACYDSCMECIKQCQAV